MKLPLPRARRLLLRTLEGLLALCAGAVGIGALAGCCVFSAPRYRGPRSDHFDGERFHNEVPPAPRQGSFLQWMLHRQPGPWADWTDSPPGPPPPRRVGPGELRVTFINHATTLIQLDGLNVLTDPIWSERCSPVSWMGPRRHRPPGLRFEELPPIDVVLVSHDHYDHLDVPTLLRLQRAFHPRFLVALGNRALLERHGLTRVTELDWWQAAPLSPAVTATSVPAQHFSNRGLCDYDAVLWTGYALTGPAGTVYFAGDTGYGPHFRELRERFGPIRLALLPIGAFRPEWFMRPVHLSPEEAVRAHRDLEAGTSVAIHFGTFALGDDGQDEAPRALEAAMAREHPPGRFWVLGFGEGRDVPPARAAAGAAPEASPPP